MVEVNETCCWRPPVAHGPGPAQSSKHNFKLTLHNCQGKQQCAGHLNVGKSKKCVLTSKREIAALPTRHERRNAASARKYRKQRRKDTKTKTQRHKCNKTRRGRWQTLTDDNKEEHHIKQTTIKTRRQQQNGGGSAEPSGEKSRKISRNLPHTPQERSQNLTLREKRMSTAQCSESNLETFSEHSQNILRTLS